MFVIAVAVANVGMARDGVIVIVVIIATRGGDGGSRDCMTVDMVRLIVRWAEDKEPQSPLQHPLGFIVLILV